MMALSKNESSSGEEWIKTECGWKLLPSIHPEVLVEVGSRSSSYSSSKTVCNNELADGTATIMECCSAPEENKKISSKQLKELNMMLYQRCVSAMPSSKESSHYSTISDAVNKLNFEQALNDEGCFPFICQVIAQLFRKPQCTLSGSMQNTLLKLMGTAKNISIASESPTKYSARVLEMISSAISWFEKLRKEQFSSFSVTNVDTKIRTLLTMNEQLNEHLASLKDDVSTAQLELDDLPVDCIQHIAKYLTHPRDLLNLGATNLRYHEITEDNHIWRGLTLSHYGHVKRDTASTRWKNLFMKHYREGKVKFERVIYGESDAARLCKKCNFVFWKAYSHPCATVKFQPHYDYYNTPVIASREPVKHDRLTPEQFLLLFVF